MKKIEVDNFEKISGQLLGVYDELTLLSKKSPTDAVNKFKLRFVNSLLSQSNEYLSSKYKPFDDFEVFDEDDMPQNSDAVFILSQYLQCFEKFRSDNVVLRSGGIWYWKVEGDEENKGDENGFIYLRTVKPKRLKD